MNYDMIRKYSTSILAAALINLEVKCVKEVFMTQNLGCCSNWGQKEGPKKDYFRN